MSHLTAAETKRNLYLVTLCKELSCGVDLGVYIIGIDVGRNTDLLDVNLMLLLTCFLLLAELLVLILAVIGDLAYGRSCGGCDLDQVKSRILSHSECFLCGHDADHIAGFADDSDFLVSYLFIDK